MQRPDLEVTLALRQLAAGPTGKLKLVGGGIYEYKIPSRPGHRGHYR
jgi:putative component of toxin-antitoxin plasmid stabilization module